MLTHHLDIIRLKVGSDWYPYRCHLEKLVTWPNMETCLKYWLLFCSSDVSLNTIPYRWDWFLNSILLLHQQLSSVPCLTVSIGIFPITCVYHVVILRLVDNCCLLPERIVHLWTVYFLTLQKSCGCSFWSDLDFFDLCGNYVQAFFLAHFWPVQCLWKFSSLILGNPSFCAWSLVKIFLLSVSSSRESP